MSSRALDLDALLTLADAAAAAGADVVRQGFGTAPDLRSKGPGDWVSEVDMSSERAVRAVLTAGAPDLPVFGEEEGGERASVGWLVDPLDGTTNFLHGFPMVGVSVGLVVDGCSVVVQNHQSHRSLARRGAIAPDLERGRRQPLEQKSEDQDDPPPEAAEHPEGNHRQQDRRDRVSITPERQRGDASGGGALRVRRHSPEDRPGLDLLRDQAPALEKARLLMARAQLPNFTGRQDEAELRTALASGEEALPIMEALGSPRDVSAVLDAIGMVHTTLADYPRALACHLRRRDLGPLMDDRAESTYENAAGAARVMRANGLRTAIVVTSPYHTRRAGLIFSRVFRAEGLAVRTRSAADSFFDVYRWWTRHRDRQLVTREYLKLLAAWGGAR